MATRASNPGFNEANEPTHYASSVAKVRTVPRFDQIVCYSKICLFPDLAAENTFQRKQ